MTRCVLDASMLIKWFKPEDESDAEYAEALLRAYSSGNLIVGAPRLVILEVLNSAVRRWRWDAPRLDRLVDRLSRLNFDFLEPSLASIARWASAGLTAYDACYVALAEELDTFVVTGDERILAVAAGYARTAAGAVAELTA